MEFCSHTKSSSIKMEPQRFMLTNDRLVGNKARQCELIRE